MRASQILFLAGISVSWMSGNSWADSVQLGSVKFTASTNVRMFRFSGDVKELSSTLIRKNGKLSSFELHIPVKSIKTGMDIRDKHTQERIFTAADGSLPDISYVATQAECNAGASASEQN